MIDHKAVLKQYNTDLIKLTRDLEARTAKLKSLQEMPFTPDHVIKKELHDIANLQMCVDFYRAELKGGNK